ncbi:histone acetyltransferase [Lithohypha guttulata]|uniref:Histone acetyltransferase n=1 Tax=Lithohypha guttulata TaxID=1690604 RepID=A0AAN7T4D6_9EURO|nr:histone acetyltransferase [Lithohypha guttulata]
MDQQEVSGPTNVQGTEEETDVDEHHNQNQDQPTMASQYIALRHELRESLAKQEILTRNIVAHNQEINRIVAEHEATAMKLIAQNLLKRLTSHAAAWCFKVPVDTTQLPEYRDKIKNPMDLGTMKKKLQEGAYKQPEDFLSDAKLIFDNCRTFNPAGNQWYNAANALEQFMWEEVRRVPEWSHLFVSEHEAELTSARRRSTGPSALAARIEVNRRNQRDANWWFSNPDRGSHLLGMIGVHASNLIRADDDQLHQSQPRRQKQKEEQANAVTESKAVGGDTKEDAANKPRPP